MGEIFNRINRILGRPNDELNSFSDMVHALWLQHVEHGWALYLYTDDVSGADIGYIFGCREDWKSVYNMNHYCRAVDVYSYVRERGCYISKAAIFNKEEVYYYQIIENVGERRISINMSSLIYGKSNVHIADLVCQRFASKWEIVASNHSRAAEANGFKSSLSECFKKIVEIEKRTESPYESMKRTYPEEFQAAMERQFRVKISQNGITFNDYFSI